MKKFLLFSFILFLNVSFAQQQTLFLDKDYKAVQQLSKTENKPIVLMFYANWCVHCNRMKNEVFTDNEVINFYNNSFICMAVDSESKEGEVLKNKFQNKFAVKSFPTFAFLDGNENLLYCNSGEFKKENFIKEGQHTLIPENQFNTIKNKFYSDVSNSTNCIRYITLVRKAGLDATEETEKYLYTKSQKDWFNELDWKIMANGINDINANEIKFIADNQAKFAEVSSPTRVEKKLVFITADNLSNYAELGDSINYYKRRPIAASFKIRKADSLLYRYDLVISERTKNWKNYQKAAESNVEKFSWKDSNTLIEICSNYLAFIDDKKGIVNAVNWARQALTMGESMEKYLLITKLYIKQKDYKNANIFAEKGKSTAVNFGWKTEEIDKLISEIKKNKT